MSSTPRTTGEHTTTAVEQSDPKENTRDLDSVIIRCDGSYHREGDLAAIGYIIETNGGEIIEKQHCAVEAATTSTQTEAHACLIAIQAGKKYNPSALFLYSDCQPVVEKVKSGDPTNQRDVYHSIRNELDNIKHVSIIHTIREYNEKAHCLAHLSLRKLRDQQH